MTSNIIPLIRRVVSVTNGEDYPKLVEWLKSLSESDFSVLATTSQTGEHIIASDTATHLEASLEDFEKHAGVALTIWPPVVSYYETVNAQSTAAAVCKSPNKHNRICIVAEPIHDDLSLAIETGRIGNDTDLKTRATILVDEFGWDATDVQKIWAFGPDGAKANMLVDQTSAVQNLNDIKDAIIDAFERATAQGPVTEEPMRGVRFSITDATVHAEATHRSNAQILCAARNAMHASTLLSEPSLLEPIYEVKIEGPESSKVGIYHSVTLGRGEVIDEQPCDGTSLCRWKAHLPVDASFEFKTRLESVAGEQAKVLYTFSHWELIGDVTMHGHRAHAVARNIRQTKHLKSDLPRVEDYAVLE
ncbi:elongation factor 2 [Stachybotrys elegans]|uniref:Elongation factor 2 n=1 Tax=Stachybotrys elegans TaxID=80388 RepID=A0A8K0SF12_9HYPO|nr:elongation factor 2 [Stachybotrys elegans]